VVSGTTGTSANRVKNALSEEKLEYYGADERKGLEKLCTGSSPPSP
jgi:hypothetical protein